MPSANVRLLHLLFAVGLAAPLWLPGRAAAQDVDLKAVLERLEKLGKRNAELEQKLNQLQGPSPAAAEEEEAPAEEPDRVQKLVQDALKEEEQKKKEEAERKKKEEEEQGYEV